MPLTFSTGRDSRLKHSTGAGPNAVAKARRKHHRPHYSTGEGASVGHFTGREMDDRGLERDPEVQRGHAR